MNVRHVAISWCANPIPVGVAQRHKTRIAATSWLAAAQHACAQGPYTQQRTRTRANAATLVRLYLNKILARLLFNDSIAETPRWNAPECFGEGDSA
ncbi:hypothetical protein [Pyruvatibacter mobilis]|uniref:hypothetical protein n=1 Tax=Pyruvatibacter mobilis TaxID=1712261 RepID=UPI003BAE9ED6